MLQGVDKFVCVCVGGWFLNVRVGIWLLPLEWGEGREDRRERENERKTK